MRITEGKDDCRWKYGFNANLLVFCQCHVSASEREREGVMGRRDLRKEQEREKEADREIDVKGGTHDRFSKRANEAVTPDRSFAIIRTSNQCWQ